MKKKEVMEKYNLHRSLFGRLVQANYIKYVSRDNYEVDEELMKDFNAEEFDKQRKEALKNDENYKQWRAERARAANAKRWAAYTDEDKAAWKAKVSKAVRKAQQENPECITKMKASLKEYWNDETHRQEHSKKMTKVYKDETKRNNLKAGIKAYWDKEESHIKASIRRKGYYDDKPEELARMKEANRRTQKAIWTEERRRLHSEKLIKVWQDRGIEMRDKTIQTMKENNTLNSSKPADECKQLLIDAGFTVQAEAPYPNKTWRCDVYVEELELYIEFHFGFYHNSEPFNPENPAHLKEAEYLKKTYGNDRRSRYAHRLYTWTDLDVRKRQYALEHEMNWFAFYSKGEFERWLKTLIS